MNEELELFRTTVQRFIQAEVMPHYERWEREEIFPRDVWSKLGEQGLLCVDLPESYGGAGADFLFSMAITEAFSRANCGAIGGPMAVHSDIVAHYLLNNGSEEQKRTYLPRMASGECVITTIITIIIIIIITIITITNIIITIIIVITITNIIIIIITIIIITITIGEER